MYSEASSAAMRPYGVPGSGVIAFSNTSRIFNRSSPYSASSRPRIAYRSGGMYKPRCSRYAPELVARDHARRVNRSAVAREALRERSLVAARSAELFERERERAQRLGRDARRDRRQRGRVDAGREEHADRHVGHEMMRDGFFDALTYGDVGLGEMRDRTQSARAPQHAGDGDVMKDVAVSVLFVDEKGSSGLDRAHFLANRERFGNGSGEKKSGRARGIDRA